ncbi:MAG: septal ring lytic transglycosylase RlpA family protein [Bryobacterales bacterium]|nr:septal ring lytic transglycosylase RlpA family protein [Bryobacterales bacterium]
MLPKQRLTGIRRKRRMACAAAAAALAIFSQACARRAPARVPAPPRIGATSEGIASWYGDPYHGRRAANGETYDMDQLTAAHRTWPFDTIVRVTNLSNQRSVSVRITDRGPFVDGRVIDLSREAAREIGMIEPGTVKVRLTVTGFDRHTPRAAKETTDAARGEFAVQVGAFRDRERAEALRAEMERKFGKARLAIREGDPPVWRVLVGREEALSEAERLAARMRQEGTDGFAVRVDE